ncbi:class I SAM-dependent methyltransferase [Thermodesulfobacteriota bacterium]
MRVSVESLTPHQKTALVVLYQRAKESRRPDGKIKDHWAEEMVDLLDYDFSELDADARGQSGIVTRARIFDRETAKFVATHPDATIVNLGAGLDTRFFRVDNGKIRWVDVDLPEMIELRRQFLRTSERLTFVSRSVLDCRWMQMVPRESPLLIIVEGLLIYFDEHDVKALFRNIADHFPKAEVLLDAGSPMSLRAQMPGIDLQLTPFKWGVSSIAELENWDSRIGFEEEWFFQDMLPEGGNILADMFGLMLRPDASGSLPEAEPSITRFSRDTATEEDRATLLDRLQIGIAWRLRRINSALHEAPGCRSP